MLKKPKGFVHFLLLSAEDEARSATEDEAAAVAGWGREGMSVYCPLRYAARGIYSEVCPTMWQSATGHRTTNMNSPKVLSGWPHNSLSAKFISYPKYSITHSNWNFKKIIIFIFLIISRICFFFPD